MTDFVLPGEPDFGVSYTETYYIDFTRDPNKKMVIMKTLDSVFSESFSNKQGREDDLSIYDHSSHR